MNASRTATVILLAGLAACQRQPSQQQTAPGDGGSIFSLHGRSAPSLTNGQVLSGVVKLVVSPLTRRGHDIVLWLDQEPIAHWGFEWETNGVAVLELDTVQFPPGKHRLCLSGEEDNTQGLAVNISKMVTGHFHETRPLPERHWDVIFQNEPPRAWTVEELLGDAPKSATNLLRTPAASAVPTNPYE